MGEDNNYSNATQDNVLQEQVDEHKVDKGKLFGTFDGVFTPTLLTILGVIMYLREGWVVGNAGLLGAWLIILISCSITLLTGLSLSSITTNIRIGAGGAFSIISQSLGLEVGGSIGIPLYLAQALAVAMYIFGFRTGWQWLFPDHPAILIDLCTFAALFIIAYISASLAFRIQYIIMAIIAGSLISVFWAFFTVPAQQPITWWGTFSGSPETMFTGIGFWALFAVFFPAATGIMAGANMSGELKNPRKSIPIGTMSAIVLSTIIYMALAYLLIRMATPEELVSNYNILLDRAAWTPIVVAGLLGATFSSALSSIVGAPRILQALGDHRILPKSIWFSTRTQSGEPRNSIIFTGMIVLVALMLRDLNAIAPLITMFFLLTYAMINVVVFMEQSLNLVSFRPLFRIPRAVSFLGATGCLFVMFTINSTFSLVAVVVVVSIHSFLLRQHLKAPFGDVRSGLFVALAEWAAKKVNELTVSRERAWRANILVPVEDPQDLRGMFNLIRDISYPKGFIKLLGLTGKVEKKELHARLPDITRSFQDEGVFSSWTIIDVPSFEDNLVAGMEALAGSFFRPNIIFLTLPSSKQREEDTRILIQKASQNGIGVVIYAPHPKSGLGRHKSINLWIDDKSPDWEISMNLGNMDLAVLVGYKLKRKWQASMNLITTVADDSQKKKAEEYIMTLAELARLPNVNTYALEGSIEAIMHEIPQAALNIYNITAEPDFEFMRRMVELTGSSCLFTLDSGEESALA
ncbi:amino acid transporter [Methanohalophilus levihalophilus]|uniref:amino acid permease n=1 Tax=Methanohalophilus levihalophilus TaxID=1431282 RepID=UPI001AE45245|nr:amino acid permease [Methanohalophilus levihalophilus]MBP2030407.1 amino acid transporter [Methanohalophilus levihalophilus]